MLNNYIPLKFLGARSVRRLVVFLFLVLTLVSQVSALTETVNIGGVKYSADYDSGKAIALGLADGVRMFRPVVLTTI